MLEFARNDDRLWDYLSHEIPALDRVSESQRGQLLRLTRALIDRSMPESFILHGIRNTADVLHDLEAAPHPDDPMQREEVRRFMAEHGVSHDRRDLGAPMARETRHAERERLVRFVTSAIRDARSAKARHEIKKTRNTLMKIDQRELRRTLGREADDYCRQINTLLRSTAALF